MKIRIMIPSALSAAIKTTEAQLQESLDLLDERQKRGELSSEAEEFAAQATAKFEVAVKDFGPVIAAWHHRAKMAQLPEMQELRAIYEQDVRDEIDGQHMLVAASFNARTEEAKLDIDRDTAVITRRLELRRSAVAELIERIAKREEMVSNNVHISHQKEILSFTASLRVYLSAINNTLAGRIPETA